ncbi:uncharacterized protein LOC116408584 [Xenopus tropicalis]|uniref:Uncharacterized protein LOC116408584 n=1 Tax=Xenopus tropicalis TaxID=8364 RepID=A0A8J1J2H2_XENTR|nr:uncharacterized protein LOC116408584 [Xenopus tropicalis]
MPEVKVLFAVLEDYIHQQTIDEALYGYYEHQYIRRFPDIDDWDHFINQYYIDYDVGHLRDMAHFIVMDAYRKQLEELEITLYGIHKVLALSEEQEHDVEHILDQYEETQQARRVVGSRLEGLHNKIVARQKELEESAKIKSEEQREEEPPVVVVEPRLSTRRRLTKAIKRKFQRIRVSYLMSFSYRSTRRVLLDFISLFRDPPPP